MGRRGPAPKKAGEKQGKSSTVGSTLKVIEGNPLLASPPEPMDWLPRQLADWDTFWTTDVAGAVAESDLPALYRLFDLRDEIERLMNAAREQPMTTGSTGQLVVNPAYKQADTFRSEVRQLEDRFGLNPSARAKLGFEGARAQRTLDDLNNAMRRNSDVPDPRVVDLADSDTADAD